MAAAPGADKPPSRSFADILSKSSVVSNLKPPSKFKGMPAVAFSDQEIHRFSQKFKFALIGKFNKGRPTMADLRKTFDLIGFGGAFSLGLIDQRHVLINFDLEDDFQRCWLRKSWSIQGYFMNIFKWTPDFRPDIESPIVPIWIAFEGLPTHLQDKEALCSIANLIGTPLKVDSSTLLQNRPSIARVCVELNVSIEKPDQVWITNGSFGGFAQPVIYEYIPPYCLNCQKFGHLVSDCKITRAAKIPQESSQEQHKEYRQETFPLPQHSAPTIVPPRKRWRPVIYQQPKEQQGEGSSLPPPEPEKPQEPESSNGEGASLPPPEPEKQKEPESSNAAHDSIPDNNANLGLTLIDDHGIQSENHSDSHPGHQSDGDVPQNAQNSSLPPLESWKTSSHLITSRIEKSTPNDFIAVTKKKSRPRKDYSESAPSVTTRLSVGGFASEKTKVWLFWSDSFEVDIEIDNEQFIFCNVSFVPWQFNFSFIAVYAKHTRADRAHLWRQLNELIDDTKPILLGGDFNVISSIAEYRGNASPDLGSISDFSEFINDSSLIDLATLGNQYTWHGVRNTGDVWKRLDRFLMTPAWRDYLSEIRIIVHARTTSDHSPILLCGDNANVSCPKQFRFQSMWTTHHGFLEEVRSNWSLPADGGGMRALAFKLKRLKQALRSWNRDIFGNVFDRIKNHENLVADIEKQYDNCPSPENRALLHKHHADLLLALKQEEMFWRQKARVKWLKEGDANTRFFHATVKDRHRRQRICAIKNDSGNLLTTQPAIQEEAISFYTKLFKAEDCFEMESILQNLPISLEVSDNFSLTKPLTREEIKEAVWKLDPDSAAGPDGFSGTFFRHCWEIVHEDVYLAALDFFAGVPIPCAIASAQLVLIPKVINPDTFADFRPISLCTFISKVFTRILATRLSKLLPKLISKEQTGFVEGRNIQDNILLAQELLQYIDKKCRGNNVMVKLDMMKAFDRVSWPFLKAVLHKFGFSIKFINLIMNNLAATRLSVLINGVSSGFFQPTRGVKQGDPLSPLLFILVSEALSRSLILKMGTGMISPYSTRVQCPTISHLAFADDIIIFINGSSNSLKALTESLRQYQAGSGQLINYNKSFFVTSKHCSAQRTATMSRILGMQRSIMPFRYLGVNLFHGRNRLIYYQSLLEKVDGKLQSWTRRLLSPGGRLTLIKHVLSMIPIYTMATIALPRQIVKTLESKFANFLWGTSEGRPKRHWASWKKLCLPQKEGGLGVRCFSSLQHTFTAKLYFNFMQGRSLWSTFMQTRYSEDTPKISDSITWRRMQEMAEFVEENTFKTPDALIWKPSTYGNFSFSSAYDSLRPKAGLTLSSECIWGGGIPTKISVFMWKLLRRLLPFPDVVERFGFCLPSICPFCLGASASLDHCLLLCNRVQNVWNYFSGVFGLPLLNTSSVRSKCHAWWLSSSPNSAVGYITRLMPSLVLWFLWVAYNESIFEGSAFSATRTIKRIKRESLLISLSRSVRKQHSSDSFLLSEGFIANFVESPRRAITWVQWLAPPPGCLKLNTDAFYSANGAAGGACLRNANGSLIIALRFPLVASSALEAEALALRFALQWCELTATIPFIIEVDSLSLALTASSQTVKIPWKIMEVVQYIRSCLSLWGSTLTHIYREANQVADALASEGLNSSSPALFHSCTSLPIKVKLALLYDQRGFSSPRF
ncbi:uncharacterized protein LOC116004702 [Ipomoea triloba]|uniref:uncharacterized protein LOC116004702 n=1 Tax=Ipomoea triloba TaxID=35885 RepID=UPI00125D5DE7|nr:uncharacterized protein LOC116004702 [Ipomoea triloba]